VLQIDPRSLGEVIESVNTVAIATGVPERAGALVEQLPAPTSRLAEGSGHCPPR
jgi:hypothetical protein